MNEKSLAIKLPIENISDELIEKIIELAESNKGETCLQFLVYEPESKIWVQMQSQSHKVNLEGDITEFLNTNPEIEYKIIEE